MPYHVQTHAGDETFVKSLGISFECKINKDTKKLEYRDLTGPVKSLLPNIYVTDDLQVLWGSFMDIMGDLKLDYTTDEGITKLDDKIKKGFEKLLTVSQHACFVCFVCSCT